MKALRTAAIVVGAVALIVTTAGAAIPAFAAAATAATGLSMAAIGAIGTLATTFATLTAKKPKPTVGGSATEFKADPNAGIPYMVGRTAHAGNIVDRETWGPDNKFQGFAIVHGGGGPYHQLEKFLVDRGQVNFAAGGAAIGSYAGHMWLNPQAGAVPSPPLPSPVAGWPGWTAGKALSGMAAALWVLKFDKDGKKFAGGVPMPMAVWKAAKVYDPRQDSTFPGGSGPCRALDESTYVFSENPYCHGVTWALGRWQNGKRVLGIGMPVDALDWPAWVDAMNIADANAWKVGGTVYSVDDKWNVLKLMCQAGGGEPMRHGALLSVTVDAPKVSILTIGRNDLAGASKVTGTQSRRDRINTIIPKVRSEAHGWQVVPLDPVSQAAYIAEDGDTRTREVEMPLVQHQAGNNQPAQLAAYMVAASREFPISLTLRTRFMGLKPGDAVTITVDDLGLENRLAVVTARALDPGSGDVSLELRSETTAKHAYCLGRTAVPPPTPQLGPNVDVSNPDPPVPGEWAARAESLGTVSGGAPAVVFTGAAANPFVDSVSFWLKPVGGDETTWVLAGTQAANVTEWWFGDVAPATSYTVAVSYQVRGVPTARTIIGNITTPALIAGAVVGQGPWATDTTLDPTTVGGQVTNLSPTGLLSSLGVITDRRLTLLRRADSVTDVTEGAVVTSLGIAASFIGQTDLATTSRAALGFGENGVVDSEFSRGLAAYYVGTPTTDNGATQPTVTRAMNYPGFFGLRQVFYASIGTPAYGPAGRYYDALWTKGMWGGQGTLADLQRYALPVKLNDRIYYRCRLAQHRCTAVTIFLIFDKDGNMIESTGIGNGAEYGGTNGDPANFGLSGETYTVTNPAAAFGVMLWRMLSRDTDNNAPFMFMTEPAMGVIPAGQTQLPAYSPGRSDPLAAPNVDITGPVEIVIPADYLGAIDAGIYPRSATFDLRLNGVSQFGLPGVTWSAALLSGNVTFTTSITDSRLTVNVTGWTADAKIRIIGSAAGGLKIYDLPVTRLKAGTPVGGTGGSSNPGTTATTGSIANVTSTSYGAAKAGPLTVKAGTAGQVAASISAQFDRSFTGTAHCYVKAQWRVPGGTWADIAAEQMSQEPASAGGGDDVPGLIDRTFTKTGLTAGADYEFQLLIRSNAGDTTLFFTGSFIVTGT